MFEPNTHRMANCDWCGKRFADDCGDGFCSSSCERQYESEHACCGQCGEEVGEDNLNGEGICETCEEEEENE